MTSALRSAFSKCEAWLQRHSTIAALGAFLIAAVIIISRRPEAIFGAQFWAEDGTFWYHDAYTHGFGSLFELYGSYLVIIYRLVAMASLSLPFELAPLFFNLVALVLQLLPVALFCSKRLEGIFRYRSLGFLVAILYTLIPNSSEIFTNLTNIQWHLGVTSFLIIIARPAKNLLWRLFDLSVIAATGLSGPLVILLAPLAFFMWWRKKRPQRLPNVLMFCFFAAVQLICVFLISADNRVGAQPHASAMGFITMITGQVFTGGLLGEKGIMLAYVHPTVTVMLCALAITLIMYAVIKGPLWLRLANAYSLLLIGAMLASLRRSTHFDTWTDIAQPGHGQRYWYIPIVVWLATLAWLALAAKNRVFKIVAICLFGLFITVGLPNDWRVKQLPYLHFNEYAQQFKQSPPGTVITIPLNPSPGWEMTLIKK